MSGFPTGLFQKFLDYLYQKGGISVPTDFPGQCKVVKEMIDNDVSGVVNTVVNYAINSASETKFKVECSNATLEDLLSLWLEQININLNGVPTGLQELAKEYYKERWAGSSLCLLRVKNWKKITVGKVSIEVPMTLWFVNGSSVYIKRPNTENFKLGTDEYFLNEAKTIKVPANKEEDIIVQKSTGRWFTEYPVPFLIQNGVYKNWKGLETLQDKGNEVITKILPYLFLIEKGDKDAFINKDVTYSDTELQAMVDNFKTAIKRYVNEKGEVPVAGIPFDQKFSHLIPDLRGMLSEELYRQGYRALLSGLGFVSVVQGIGDSRKEEVINPKPFVATVNAGVDGFKSILIDVIRLISIKNKAEHKKLFSENKELKITNTPLKINTALLLDNFRSAFIYGVIGYTTYQEILGVDPDQELERARKEWESGLRDTFYPHIVQNTEKDPDVISVPTTKKQTEKQKEKETQPPNMQTAINQEELEIAPYQNVEELIKKHPYMKKYPKGALEVFIQVFNESLPKGEDYAFPVAYTAMKRWLKKHGYKKVGDKWVKSEEEQNNENK